MYIHVCTWYVHGKYNPRDKRVCTLFRHVCTCLHYYVPVLNHIKMYLQCTNLYIGCCVAHVQCTDGYIHFMKFTDIAEPGTYIDISFWIQLFYLPSRAGWPAGWDWLLPGVTPIQVQAHEFNQHQLWAFPAFLPPPPPFPTLPPPPLPPGLGARGGPSQ